MDYIAKLDKFLIKLCKPQLRFFEYIVYVVDQY